MRNDTPSEVRKKLIDGYAIVSALSHEERKEIFGED